MRRTLCGSDRSAFLAFSIWNMPLPKLDRNYKTKDNCFYNIPTQFEGGYNVYIGPKKDLVIPPSHEASKGVVNVNGAVTFLPEDIDDVIKGLLYQAAKGLGRTSAKELVGILEHRFSPEFGKRQSKLMKG